jgi:hypothetical protein
MSDQKTSTTARRVLCDVDEVYAGSLPHSLRHTFEGDALQEAASLVIFLRHVAFSFEDKSEGLYEQGASGLGIILDLILDKIEIGQGAYKFPRADISSDVPALVKREED